MQEGEIMSIEEKKEYYDIVFNILENTEFQKRKHYKHHGDITVYSHSLAVSKNAYLMAKKMKCDYKSAAIAGLLHDFYYEPWQDNKTSKSLFKKHGFTHAKEALENSRKHFPDILNNRIENSIKRHMFPLNIVPPKYLESWIITFADKYVSMEVFLKPSKLPLLIGIKFRKGDM